MRRLLNSLAISRATHSLVLMFSFAWIPLMSQVNKDWEDDIIFTTGYMGPNALPVPQLLSARLDNAHCLAVNSWYHTGSQDWTVSGELTGQYTFVPDKVAFRAWWVPLEYFYQSPEVQTARNTFPAFADDRDAIGDVYLETLAQVIRRERWQVLARAGYKIPSSNGVGNARFTDSPGYYLDLSSSWQLWQQGERRVDLNSMAGFYSYQTQGGSFYRQNDALLFGIGAQWYSPAWNLAADLRGYLGYFQLDDQPIVTQLRVRRRLGSSPFQLELTGQVGLNDYPFRSLSLGMQYRLQTK